MKKYDWITVQCIATGILTMLSPWLPAYAHLFTVLGAGTLFCMAAVWHLKIRRKI